MIDRKIYRFNYNRESRKGIEKRERDRERERERGRGGRGETEETEG